MLSGSIESDKGRRDKHDNNNKHENNITNENNVNNYISSTLKSDRKCKSFLTFKHLFVFVNIYVSGKIR